MAATIDNEDKTKSYYNPFDPVVVDPRVTSMKRSTEERMYIVLYYNTEYEEYKHAIFYGRYNVYFGIKNILDSESIDLRASTVLVETVGIDPVSKDPKRYLIHPENASDIVGFCKQMEAFFGENSYSLEEYGITENESAEVDTSDGFEVVASLKKSTIDNKDKVETGNVDESSLFTTGYSNVWDKIRDGSKYFVNPALMDKDIQGKEI